MRADKALYSALSAITVTLVFDSATFVDAAWLSPTPWPCSVAPGPSATAWAAVCHFSGVDVAGPVVFAAKCHNASGFVFWVTGLSVASRYGACARGGCGGAASRHDDVVW